MAARRPLKGILRIFFISATVLSLGVAVYNIFHLNVMGYVMMDQAYWAALLALLLPFTFLIFAPSKKASVDRVPWYDMALALLSVLGPLYVFVHGESILVEAWSLHPTRLAFVLGLLTWILLIEATRRVAGIPLLIVVVLFSIYPLFASYMPSILVGKVYSIQRIVGFHFLSPSSMFGLPMQVFGRLILGFMFFGVALQVTGGGNFFLNLSLALLGHVRGGPAKVSILASSFFATMSGVAVSNVITTGSITIPTMIRAGYPPYFAGAVEATASTGGLLMPPVMGITAFIMADFLQMPYYQICLAAALPIILYYLGLFIQLDFYAARAGLKGLKRDELPSLTEALKQGWFYLGTVAVLVYFLFYARVEAWAPFYATIFLFICAFTKKATRPRLKTFVELFENTGNSLVNLTPLLAAVGMILGALSITGVAHSFASELTDLAGGNLPLLLGFSALGSLIIGMGMPAVTCYIFLAMLIGPALIDAGLNPIAAHLFFLYWGMLGFITPPVCLSVYAACGIAGSTVMRTGFQAVRLGLVGFLIPVFFVINPALIGKGSFAEVIHSLLSAVVGVLILGAAMEGYILFFGRLNWIKRIVYFCGGILLMFPGWKTDMTGIALILVALLLSITRKMDVARSV